MEMVAAMMEARFSRERVWPALYALMALLTLIFQVYVRSPQCAPDCALSFAKAVAWASIWPASWIVYIAGIV
jgi:hypothetical protein